MGSICLGVSFDFGVCAAVDLQLAVHGEYTGGFANKRRDDSVQGRGEIGNRWENCSNSCLCFDMTN